MSPVVGGTGAVRLNLCHPADPRQLRVLRFEVRQWACDNAVPAETLIDLQLALVEAVTNGVEHAYRDRPPGTVEVELELHADGDPSVAVAVVDHGQWRPIPLRKAGRGRGLAIIQQLSRGLHISTNDGGTRLSFAVPLRR